MQFTNTSGVTPQTDTNQHNAGVELHAKLRNDEQHTSTPGPAGVEVAGGAGGPGRGAGGRRQGQAAAPVGGGGAWPGFETTRRAKLAARTASGRAAAHGCIKQPGPARQPSGARNSSGAATTRSRPAPQGPGGSRIRPLGGSQRLFQRIWVPSEPRRWQASTTRAAMPASADLPHVRGSYCFFTPTSPSILRTPS